MEKSQTKTKLQAQKSINCEWQNQQVTNQKKTLLTHKSINYEQWNKLKQKNWRSGVSTKEVAYNKACKTYYISSLCIKIRGEGKERLFEASTMEMCTQGIAWDLLNVLQMSKPQTI